MELREFIENHLPNKEQNKDYQTYKRLDNDYKDLIKGSESLIKWLLEMDRMEMVLFSEALQNFADTLCERQAKNCCYAYRNSCEKEKYDQWIEHTIYGAERGIVGELVVSG